MSSTDAGVREGVLGTWPRLLLSFAAILTCCLALAVLWLKSGGESRRVAAIQAASIHAQAISLRLNETMGAAYMLAGLVRQGSGEVSDFARQASSIALIFPLAASLQLAPNGVIQYAYPKSDAETIIGSDLLRSPARRAEAHQAMVKQKLVVGGPYPTIQGGIAAIGRYPVFVPTDEGWEDFWGFAIVLVSLPELLASARVADLVENGYRFEICRLEEGGECDAFAQRGSGVLREPIEVGIEVAQGRWLLRVEPEDGWIALYEIVLIAVFSLFAAIVVTAIRYRMSRAIKQG